MYVYIYLYINLVPYASIPFTGLLQTHEFHFQCCEITFQANMNRIQRYEIEYRTIEIQFQSCAIQFHTNEVHF